MKNQIMLLIGIVFALKSYTQSTVTDIDGNIYDTIAIGTQVWLKQNLKTTKYCDGTSIPNIANNSVWQSLTSGARSYYNNDSTANALTYGSLYNWYAASNTEGICPKSWHVPSDGEWNILEKYLDNTVDTLATGFVGTDIGCKLKEMGTLHWIYPNTCATNSSDFSALPGGTRNSDGSMYHGGEFGSYWSSTAYNTIAAYERYLNNASSKISRYIAGNGYGFSIRCISDFTVQIIENNYKKNIFIYPNPVKNILTIDSQNILFLNVTVYNLFGICIYKQTIVNESNKIDLSFLMKGVYFIVLSNNSEIIMQQKLIKD